MLIKFQDSQGRDLVDTVNIGANNSIVVNLVITGDATPISGKVFKNSTQIGEYTWTAEAGQRVIWYMGVDQPIYVADRDVLKAVTTSPTYPDVIVSIIRSQPDLDNIVSLAGFVEAIRPMAPNSAPVSRIRLVIDQIALNSSIVYSQRTPINIANIKAYVLNNVDLPDQEANIFGDPAELANALATYVPPTLREIFDNWTRFVGNEYYKKGTTIPSNSEANAWFWDDTVKGPVMPLNSVQYNGFLSIEEVDNYDHEVTVTSPDADDDWNGPILAFKRENNVNYSLVAWVCCDGTGNSNPATQLANVSLSYFSGGSRVVFDSKKGNEKINGWRGSFKRVRVIRRGNIFTVNFTRWDELTYDPILTMTIDVSTDARLQKFQGKCVYGYGNLSQAKSTFKDIRYVGGLMRDTIIDGSNNRVYRYDTLTTTWVLVPNFTAQDLFGSPRTLINPTNDEVFRLNVDGTITKLN